MFFKVLIANRGEIAVRVIRAARALGIQTVLTVSEFDKDGLAARLADETIVIGPAPAGKSYLNTDAVISALQESGAEAVHPGFGFLSENADFARAVIQAGAVWVGPAPETIELMGNKSRARQAAEEAGVPILAGTDGAVHADEDIAGIAQSIGYPLVVKASSGGGGRGIRLVENPEDLLSTVELAQAEATAAFGDPAVYIERFIPHARHIEVQILGDGERFVHLGDRDCSMQRKHQKVLEEALAPAVPEDVRSVIHDSSVELARQSNYTGAGTVEFLYDPERREASFIEMNTRIQVEHPITEMVTGVDIVAEQLRIAAGEGLSLEQADITFSGHAIEARINAEDPTNSFMPSPGTLSTVVWPEGEGVRVDTGFDDGDTIAPFYDSMIAKVIVHGPDRPSAIRRMDEALSTLSIGGIASTKPLLLTLIRSAEFAQTQHSTTFIETSNVLKELT